MAITIIPEDGTGLATANSYVSLADATLYFEAHLYAATWTAADSATKNIALAQATRLLDAHARFVGQKKTSTQALQWPRTEVCLDGFEVSSSTVPQPIKDATAELAMLLLSNDLTTDVDQNQVSSIGLGKGALKLTLKDGKSKRQIPFHVEALLRGLGVIGGGSGINQRTVRR